MPSIFFPPLSNYRDPFFRPRKQRTVCMQAKSSSTKRSSLNALNTPIMYYAPPSPKNIHFPPSLVAPSKPLPSFPPSIQPLRRSHLALNSHLDTPSMVVRVPRVIQRVVTRGGSCLIKQILQIRTRRPPRRSLIQIQRTRRKVASCSSSWC